jgi:beta-N-acetylhexosaminidase
MLNSTFKKILVFSLFFMVFSCPENVRGESLETKIGRMIMVGFRGAELSEESPIVEDIVNLGISGVILLDHEPGKDPSNANIRSPNQTRELISSLKSLPGGDELLIAVRHEGGENTPLKEVYGFPGSLSQGILGMADDIDLTRQNSLDVAQTLSKLGINLNLAPMLSLDPAAENPEPHGSDRIFSHDPEVVVKHAWEVINAHRVFNLLTAVKYFPGKGDADENQQGLVESGDTWDDLALFPFREIIQDPGCDMIVMANSFNPGLDPEWPSTLSEKTVTGLLRQKLGYTGVIITHDMQDPKIRDNYPLEVILERAITAGADIIMFANSRVYEPDIAGRSAGIIKNLVEEGRITKSRINESYLRIKDLKSRLRPMVESDCSFCIK